MKATIFLPSRIGVLVALQFFIWMTLRTLCTETAGSTSLRPLRQTSNASAKRFQCLQTSHQLLVTSGLLADSRTSLSSQRDITTSRLESNAFVLSDDFTLGQYVRAINRDDIWYLEDLDPCNGTLLNGQCVE